MKVSVNKTHKYKNISRLLIGSILLVVSSCRKIVDINTPPTKATLDKIVSDSSLLNEAVLNIYPVFGNSESFVALNSLYIDELNTTSISTTFTAFFSNSLTSLNTTTASFWKNFYSTIYQANVILENLSSAVTVSETLKTRYRGECEFLRAYSYLYLVNIYGDVPLILSSNVNVSAIASRTPAATVYSQIITDLQDAEAILLSSYPSEEKVRATKYAASALLARVYLYNKQYPQAEAEASAVINSGLYTPLPPPNNAFLKSSQEAIFQIWNANGYTPYYSGLIPASFTPTYYLTDSLYNSFEAGDLRKESWTTVNTVNSVSYNCFYKYKQTGINTDQTAEYASILRCSEQYLIRAEAEAQQNNLSGAISDLDIIRSRAGLANLSASLTQPEVLNAVMQERKVELFVENGHRFFDLKRWGIIDSVLQATKTNWHSYDQLYPISKNDLNFDPNLTQNPGYN